ncbi:MAG: hypothetical protein PF795_10335 [Kiritimatiellae bacterium]|nr:hypothetical protein [Kiritimatiellia bacterium]
MNDFDASAYLVYQTGIRLPDNSDPDPNTGVQRQQYATLCMPGQGLSRIRMYMDAIPGSQAGLIHDVQIIKNYSEESSGGVAYDFLVYPTRSSREGGGLAFTLFDAGAKSSHTHSLFYQQNYRTNYINGYHSAGTGDEHLVEWARAHKKKGAPGNKEFFKAHLVGLTDPELPFTRIRWGALNTGDPNSSYETVALAGLGARVGFVNLLYDLPRTGIPLASLGQFQHFNVNSSIEASAAGNPNKTITLQSWQMNYSLSNSYANPRVLRERLMDSIYSGFHYDGSYIWNQILWDRFFLSTYPAGENFDFSTETLVNALYLHYRIPLDPSAVRGDGDPGNQANSRLAARNLLVEGGFNINSTSKEAWKALFASLRNVPVGTETDTIAPFVRTLVRHTGSTNAKTANHENSWSGFRDLTHTEVDALAEEMVRQVKLRGPFLSLSDFVNRKLIPKSEDTHGLGLKGALQSAIDSAVNNRYSVHLLLRPPMTTHPNRNPDLDMASATLMDGFPGYLLQGDVLSAIGPHITARSDTFRIRAYGDAGGSASGGITAQAWCEAIVQRVPDYVDPADAPYDDPTSVLNTNFGRRYKIISFRWLRPQDI